MIPVRLWLRNFMSYGEDVPPLDFTSFTMACLSGRNGHGKSALLDALTWALWGKARKAGHNQNPDADLLRLNATEMAVEFTFLLDNNEYQVYREYNHGKRSSSRLEFRGKHRDENTYQLLTEHSKSATQQRIIDTLGLDFRTFVNSSFLRQGKADEFTRQSPRDRKEILAKILGLEQYDKLLEETKERLKTVHADQRLLDDQLQHIASDLEMEETWQEKLSSLQEESNELGKKANEISDKMSKNIEIRTHLLYQQKRRDENKAKEQTILKQIEENVQRSVKSQEEIKELQTLLNNKQEIEEQYNQLQDVQRKLNDLLSVEEALLPLQNREKELQKAIDQHLSQKRESLVTAKTKLEQINNTIAQNSAILKQGDEIEKKYQHYQNLYQQYQTLEEKKKPFDTLEQEIKEIEETLRNEETKIKEKVAELKGLLNRKEAIQQMLKKSKQAAKELQPAQEKLTQLEKNLEDLANNGSALNVKIEQYNKQIEQSKQTIIEHKNKLAMLKKGETQHCPLCKTELQEESLASIQEQYQNDIQTQETTIKQQTETIATEEKKREELRKHYTNVKQEIQQHRDHTTTLQSLTKEAEQNQKEWDSLQSKEIELKKLQQQLESKNYAQEIQQKLQTKIKEKQDIGFDPDRFNALQKELQERRNDEQQWQEYQKALNQSKELESQQKSLQETTQSLETIIEEKNFAKEEQEALCKIQAEIEPLQKKISTRKTLQDIFNKLQNVPGQWNRLQNAQERIPTLQDEITALEKNHTELIQQQKALEAENKSIDQEITTLPEIEGLIKSLQEQQNQCNQTIITKQQELGGIQENLNRLKKRKEEAKEKKALRKKLDYDEFLYTELKKAFSRNGIPALIMEQSLPELEEDANRLLHRLSHGTCSVRLESQRETKSGKMSETLDIMISDELGTRDYEMFSGGEAFRTDLAIRIALSQLLCRRAGSKLQLLIIDEGFGTQDTEGLYNITEAIHDIHDDFEKILVITHLEELKEKFLTRIEVNKEPGVGSYYSIIHGGNGVSL